VLSSPDEERFPGEAQAEAQSADAERAACEPWLSDAVQAADAEQAACVSSLSDAERAADAEQAAYEPSLSDEVWDGPRSA
jgi:hypothetical protein